MIPEAHQSRPPRVFISYSHDSREHENRVLALTDRLRQDGVDAIIDQYVQAPSEGWPMWMDREVQKADFVLLICTQTYRRRVEGREQPGKGRGVLWEAKLVYTLLYEADTAIQRFLPVLLEGCEELDIPTPVRGLTHYRLSDEHAYEDLYRHITIQPTRRQPELGRLKALPAMLPQSYPASLTFHVKRDPPTGLDQRNRQQLLKRVRLDWVDGVLDQSLYQVARLELRLEPAQGSVERPVDALVQVPDRAPVPVPTGVPLSRIFDDSGQTLLILGAPGTGKTTFLLELARELLDGAAENENNPMPVVFNLSSWAIRRKPLEQWLIAELNERSDVPKRVAKQWVESEQITPLLDGLDEVAPQHRQACVTAINDFRRDHGLLPIAICSRTADYDALGTRLRLRHAVLIQTLTKSQVQEYIESAEEPMKGLRTALERDPSLWELLETPLMLWVAMLAYRDTTAQFFAEETLDHRRRRLFGNFVDAMFRRRSSACIFTQDQTVYWLSLLARTLIRLRQTVFYLEDLSVNSLPRRRRRWIGDFGIEAIVQPVLGLVSGVIVALVFGLVFGLMFGRKSVLDGLPFGIIFGIIAWLLSSAHLRPVEKLRMQFTNIRSQVPRAIRSAFVSAVLWGLMLWLFEGLFEGWSIAIRAALRGGPIFGMVFGLFTLVAPEVTVARFQQARALASALILGPLSGLLLGAYFWLAVGRSTGINGGVVTGFLVGLIGGVITMLKSEAVEIRRSPNEGTRNSVKNALLVMSVVAMIFALVFGIAAGKKVGLIERLIVGLPFGLILGIIGAMISGGLFFLMHFFLRLVLWAMGSGPLNYPRFLDYAAERLFLRRVGGGYIFLHRMLMETFASMLDADQPTHGGHPGGVTAN